MVAVMSSETSGSCDLTVNCIFTPSESANLARTKTSMPPRNTPTKEIKELNLRISLLSYRVSRQVLNRNKCQFREIRTVEHFRQNEGTAAQLS